MRTGCGRGAEAVNMTGAEILVRMLAEQNVTHVFGIPGGAVIPLYDALYDAPFVHLLMRHEQAAVHAADGYARVSGRPGVCICTSGPGFTNSVTGLATAFADSVPLVLVCGQVATSLIGADAFQEADVFGGSLAVVKHSFMIRDLSEIAETVRSAFGIAVAGRPGPVLVEFPVNLQRESGSFVQDAGPSVGLHEPAAPRYGQDFAGCLRLLEAAERPVILAGGGVVLSNAADALLSCAEKLQAPVATTLMGKGSFPESCALALGMAGMHGTPQANLALSEADVILAIGARFSDRTTGAVAAFGRRAKIIHIDIDAAEMGKVVAPHAALVADAGRALRELTDGLGKANRPSWEARVRELREHPFNSRCEGESFRPREIIERIRNAFGDAVPVVADVGQNQMWTALHWKAERPRTFLTSGGLGTMGYALPAAIGASFANALSPVACIAGDGGFLMNAQELETCVRYAVPVRIFVLNNGCLGMVRQWQELFWNGRCSQTVTGTPCDFVRLAEAFGIPGFSCSSLRALDAALSDVVFRHGPVLVECRIAQKENVFPMVPAGRALEDFLSGAPGA